MSKDDILATMQAAIEKPRNAYLDQWVAEGRKVMGYYCSYIPEELFSAAGLLPYRLRGAGSDSSAEGDAYMSARVCTFVRHTISLALRGELDFLDGVVLAQNCDHIRRAGDLFRKKVRPSFYGFLSIPRAPKERVFDWYLAELRRLKAELEAHYSRAITSQSLEEAIALHNATRERIARLYELRKRESPPVTGREALTVTVAAHVMPRARFNELMDDLLADLEQAKGNGGYRARVIVTGGVMDEPEYLATVEKQGALSVAELVCFGQRSFGNPIESGPGDPLERIARQRFFQVPCARMVECFDDQVSELMRRMKEYRADGIIFQRMKFCDPWAGDGHNLYWRMKEAGIPFLSLDREYQVAAAGQVKTRVQAFMEQMGK
ncbi:MAG: 2-hydroxyacyl-CoA dehydratase [Chloroflexi bacterium]|nr:2-hydroxyacyl-CoA dehydratase [Chloroflexota bacterium]